ncbi:MAG: hypothetical protein B6I31_00120 [Desulfobacteraceae bacterium 4572_19]|nr:MAG: hypothetical protein B6I31_00120 [Desulfobacteraceae bacterium 4572_19]
MNNSQNIETREDLAKKLIGRQLSLVIAKAGWGKTYLGNKVIDTLNEDSELPIFPYVFRRKTADEGEEFLNALAQFLVNHGKTELQQYLTQRQDKVVKWKEERVETLAIVLGNDLRNLECFLWFDDLQKLSIQGSLTERITHWLVHDKPADSKYQLLLTGRSFPIGWQDNKFENTVTLPGLTTSEIKDIFKEIDLTNEQIETIEQYTKGHPLLLILLRIIAVNSTVDEAIQILKDPKTNDIPRLTEICLEHIWKHVVKDEHKELLIRFAFLDGAEEQSFVKHFEKYGITVTEDTLNDLARIGLLQSLHEETSFDLVHVKLREFIRKIAEYKNYPQYHIDLAELYEERAKKEQRDKNDIASDWLETGLHYQKSAKYSKKSEDFTRSADIFIKHSKKILRCPRRQEYLMAIADNNFNDKTLPHLWQPLLEKRAETGLQLTKFEDDDITLRSYRDLYILTKHSKWLFNQGRFYHLRGRLEDNQKAIKVLKQALEIIGDEDNDSLLEKAQALALLASVQSISKNEESIKNIQQALSILVSDLKLIPKFDLDEIDSMKVEDIDNEQYVNDMLNDMLVKVPESYWHKMANILRYIWGHYFEFSRGRKALACLVLSKALFEKTHDELNVAAISINLGMTYLRFVYKLEKAKEYFTLAEKVFSDHQQLFGLLRTYSELTSWGFMKGEFYFALTNANKMFDLNLDILKDIALEQRGFVYESIGEYEKSEKDYIECLNLTPLGEHDYQVMTRGYLGNMYICWARKCEQDNDTIKARDKLLQATKIFNESFEIIKKHKKFVTLSSIARTHVGLAEIRLKNNDLDNAKLEVKIAKTTFDSILEDDTRNEYFFIEGRIHRVQGEILHKEGASIESVCKELEKAWHIFVTKREEKLVVDKEEIWVLNSLVNLCQKEANNV